MNIKKRLLNFVQSNAAPLREANMGHSQATLSTLDSDDHLYRRLTQTTRDLGSLTAERQREIAYFLADVNPFAKRVIDMKKDFIVGDVKQWKIQSDNEDVQTILNAHWNDPINDWPNKLESRVRELGLAGEQCYTAVTGEDGIVRLGYVDPGVIKAVRPLEDNFEIFVEVILKAKEAAGKEVRLKVVNYNLSKGRYVGISKDAEGADAKYQDQCFFFAINKPIRATRGRSDLFSVSDGIDMIDRFHWNRQERTALMNAFMWDWTLEGMDADEVREFAKNQGAPKPGSSRYHNESVKVEAVTPNLQSHDASEEGRMMRTPLLVGSGFPEHWLFGVGDNANRASAYEMSDPPMRMLAARQSYIVNSILSPIFRFQVAEAAHKGMIKDKKNLTFSIEVPEISSRDLKKSADVLESVGRTCNAAIDVYVSRRTAIELFAFTASQLGMEVDAKKEMKRLSAEHQAQIKNDLEGLVLPGQNGNAHNGRAEPDYEGAEVDPELFPDAEL